jgi:hypothetical protein
MNTFPGFEKIVDIPVSKQQPIPTRKTDNLFDEYTKRKWKWDKAKNGKETTAALIVVNEMVLYHLKQVTNCATGDLVQLVEQYARLSLVGSCSARVRTAITLLEGAVLVSNDKAKAKVTLDHMERKLELLNKIEEDIQKGPLEV